MSSTFGRCSSQTCRGICTCASLSLAQPVAKHWSGYSHRLHLKLLETDRYVKITYQPPGRVVVQVDSSPGVLACLLCVNVLFGDPLSKLHVITTAAPQPAATTCARKIKIDLRAGNISQLYGFVYAPLMQQALILFFLFFKRHLTYFSVL